MTSPPFQRARGFTIALHMLVVSRVHWRTAWLDRVLLARFDGCRRAAVRDDGARSAWMTARDPPTKHGVGGKLLEGGRSVHLRTPLLLEGTSDVVVMLLEGLLSLSGVPMFGRGGDALEPWTWRGGGTHDVGELGHRRFLFRERSFFRLLPMAHIVFCILYTIKRKREVLSDVVEKGMVVSHLATASGHAGPRIPIVRDRWCGCQAHHSTRKTPPADEAVFFGR